MWDDERDMGKAILYANQRIRTLVPQAIVQHYSLNVEIRLTEQHDHEWSRLFALKKVPCLVTESKQKLTEVIAIMYYLVNLIPDQPTRDVLLGADFSAKAQILHYLWLANCGFCMPMATCLLQIQGVIPYFKPDFDRARAAMDKIAESYEQHLKEQKYLTGNDITLADLFTAAIFTRALQYMYGEEWRESHPAITSWFYDVTDTPILRDFYKDFAPCKEAVKPAKAK